MTFEQLQSALDNAKEVYDLAQDMSLRDQNVLAIRSGDMAWIRQQLQKSVERFGETINQLTMFSGVQVVQMNTLPEGVAVNSLAYITNNVPSYILYEKLRDEWMKQMLGGERA